MNEKNDSTKPFYLQKSFRKVHILIVLSVVGLVGIFIMLNRVSATAEEIKEVKANSASESDMANYAFLEAELGHYQSQIDELNSLYADSSEVIVFMGEVNRLNTLGVVEDFGFVNDAPVKDKSGNFGFPVSIKLRGTEEQLDAALRNIQSLPFLLRGVQVDITRETNAEGVESIVLNYGGFLYVEDAQTN